MESLKKSSERDTNIRKFTSKSLKSLIYSLDSKQVE